MTSRLRAKSTGELENDVIGLINSQSDELISKIYCETNYEQSRLFFEGFIRNSFQS